MEKIKELAGEKVHTRSITIATRPLDGDRILVEGELVDTRLTEYFLLSGEKKEPPIEVREVGQLESDHKDKKDS